MVTDGHRSTYFVYFRDLNTFYVDEQKYSTPTSPIDSHYLKCISVFLIYFKKNKTHKIHFAFNTHNHYTEIDKEIFI